MDTENQEQSTVAEEPTAEVVTPPQPKTPTIEELIAERDAIKADKIKVEESYKSLQRTLNKTNDDLKRTSDLKQELADLREMQKLQAALIAESLNKSENDLETDVKTRKPDLLQTFEAKSREIDARRKQTEQTIQQQELIAQAKVLQDRTLAMGLTEESDDYWAIRDMVERGQFQRAEIKLKKMEVAKAQSNPKQEPEEEKINRLAQERYEKRLRDEGLLKTDSASPSGRSVGNADIIRRYSEGDQSVSHADYMKATGRG